MCGRVSSAAIQAEIDRYYEYLRVKSGRPRYERSWNVAPSQKQLVIAERSGEREARYMTWGFLPVWAKPGMRPMINARRETVATSPMFRDAFRYRRGLVLADSFYEWRVNERGPKTPFRIRVRGEELMLLAAIWERAGEIETCAIITTSATGTMLRLHHRMPLIIARSDVDAWLGGSVADAVAILDRGITDLDAYAVTQYVNAPRNNSEMCWERDESAA